MKYFLDTEFIEGFHKPLFGKRRHFIDLISIGIVREDGRTYSAISSNYDYKDADKWVKENVVLPLYISNVSGDARNHLDVHNFHKSIGKPTNPIAYEILNFFGCYQDSLFWRAPPGIEIYGYYADYDWVLFCSLFGRMIDLPKNFPMYCIDLKQEMDRKARLISDGVKKQNPIATVTLIAGTGETIGESWKRLDCEDKILAAIKEHRDYPKQDNEHDALADAQWNKKLYEFIQNI